MEKFTKLYHHIQRALLMCGVVFLSSAHSNVIVDKNYINALESSPLLLSEPVTEFTKHIYKVISEDPSNNNVNIIASPLSIHSALSMLFYGSPIKTPTHDELAKALYLDSKPVKHFRHSKYHFLNLFRYYDNSGKEFNAVVNLANKIYLQDGFEAKERYLNLLAQFFLTSAEIVDFTSPVEAAEKMNNFVTEKTNGLIKSILEPSNIDSLTKLILINAIYFKAGWKYPFNPSWTSEIPFTLLNGTEVFHERGMEGEFNLRYGKSEKLNADILELPYTNPDLNMYIMVPELNTLESLNRIATTFDIEDIQSSVDYAPDESLLVNMPAFKSSFQANMNDVLQQLGSISMFDPTNANFSIITDEKLWVGDVLHKANIIVDEKGSEAAAVTGISVGVRGYPDAEDEFFYVDRPFIYAIYDTKNKMPLFIGRLMDPRDNK